MNQMTKEKIESSWQTYQIMVTCTRNLVHFFHVFLYKPGLSYRPDHDDHNNMITAQDTGVINLLPYIAPIFYSAFGTITILYLTTGNWHLLEEKAIVHSSP